MSYASVASHNIPFGEMPKPDQNLADGPTDTTEAHALRQDEKINVLPAGSDLDHPPIEESEPHPSVPAVELSSGPIYEPKGLDVGPKPTSAPTGESKFEKAEKKAGQTEKEVKKDLKEYGDKAEKNLKEFGDKAEKKGKEFAKKARAELDEAESKLGPYWEKTKDVVLRPGTLGGLMGVVNVGLLGTLGYFAYTKRDQPWDRSIVGGAVAGTLALFGAEGYVADSYLSTEEGKREAERAKREGSKFYLEAKERVLRPGVFGGLAGALNLAVIGTVGYFSYQNWNRPWDRRVVSGVTVGLLALSGLEGWAGKEYVDKGLPKRR